MKKLFSAKVSNALKTFFEETELKPNGFYSNEMDYDIWKEAKDIAPYRSDLEEVEKLGMPSIYIAMIHEDVKDGWLQLASKEKFVLGLDVYVKGYRTTVYYQNTMFVPTDERKDALTFETKEEANKFKEDHKLDKSYVASSLNDF